MELVHRKDIKRGGFAGLRETRMVMDARAWGYLKEPGTFPGIGSFVYLADARFLPHGETGMHPHKEIDVISLMAEGRIDHQGSLEHGQELLPYDIQVQRGGREGFLHNEINPDDVENRMIQIWMLPEVLGEPSGYRIYHVDPGERVRVYGGDSAQSECFASKTIMEVLRLNAGAHFHCQSPCIGYLVTGVGNANGRAVCEGHLIRDNDFDFEADEDTLLILVSITH